jgi:hypothetical protein
MSAANKKHRDSVFTFLFSNPEALRELYSAIRGVTLPPDIPVDINTLSDDLFGNQTNDISFTIDDQLVVISEYQSTIKNNVPLRFLLYLSRLFEELYYPKIRFRRKLVEIPTPEFIVLYNGKDPYPDYNELNLSDTFSDNNKIKTVRSLELSVDVYNINKGHNKGILSRSIILENYSAMIDKVREYQKENESPEKAICSAIKYCIENDILGEFLRKHVSKVANMLYADYAPKVEMAGC